MLINNTEISIYIFRLIDSKSKSNHFSNTFSNFMIGSGALFKTLFESPNFRVTVVGDSDTVEICGALKNIVAVGAGFIDGMKCGDNTKAAVIRIGLMEMIRYCKVRRGFFVFANDHSKIH